MISGMVFMTGALRSLTCLGANAHKLAVKRRVMRSRRFDAMEVRLVRSSVVLMNGTGMSLVCCQCARAAGMDVTGLRNASTGMGPPWASAMTLA